VIARLLTLLETLFVWTVGPFLILFFSPKARTARFVTLGTVGAIGAAWWTGLIFWALGMAVGYVPDAWLGGPVSVAERAILERTLTEASDEGSPTYEHTLRMERRAAAFAKAESVHEGALHAAVMLHDATLEHPAIPVEGRYCSHGQTGTIIAVRVLRQLEERNAWYALAVGDAVLRHVGPTGFNWEWQDKRVASKKCEGRILKPVSALSKALYDLDAMDRLTVDHVVREAAVRKAQPGNEKKQLADIVRLGRDSLLKELSDDAQTLHTRTARACGKQLHKHAATFVRDVNWRTVKTPAELRSAAAQYLKLSPTPSCLDAPTASSADISDAEMQEAGGPAD